MAERGKRKPSGAEYPKQKAEKEKDQAKQQGSFLKYLLFNPNKDGSSSQNPDEGILLGEEVSSHPHGSSLEHQDAGEGSSQHQTDMEVEKIYSLSETHAEIEVNEVEGRKDEEVTNKLQYGDPASWPRYDDSVQQILMEHGPEQVQEFPFPKDGNKRKFSAQHYKRKLINGEKINQNWL
ncbi:unnamed protein product [Natator depressus]